MEDDWALEILIVKSSSSKSLIKFSIRAQPSSIGIFYSLYVVEFRGCLLGAISIFLIGLFIVHDHEKEDMDPGLGFCSLLDS